MLITEEYRELNAQLHRDKPSYGMSAKNHFCDVTNLLGEHDCSSLLDYGSGKGTLKKCFDEILERTQDEFYEQLKIYEYEPAFPDKLHKEPCDLVVALDVLEHIEPICLEDVLDDIAKLTKKCFFATIATRPAKKQLADGRNAHLIVREPIWWIQQLDLFFRLKNIFIDDDKGEVQVECLPIHTIT